MTEKKSVKKNTAQRRSAARLAAVQALYNSELSDRSADAVLQDFLEHGMGATVTMAPSEDEAEVEHHLIDPDGRLLTSIFRGALEGREDFDRMIAAALSGDWSMERLESVLRAILRAGTFELARRPETPVKVVLSEYVDIAHAFYSGPEPGLVNAVLDRIARIVRAEEIGSNAGSR